MAEQRRLNLDFPDADALRSLCGERDVHFRWLEQELGVVVHARGQQVSVQGPDGVEVVKAKQLSGKGGLLYRRNSRSGAVEALPRSAKWEGLNAALHAND